VKEWGEKDGARIDFLRLHATSQLGNLTLTPIFSRRAVNCSNSGAYGANGVNIHVPRVTYMAASYGGLSYDSGQR
jgi:hypothetical protein